MVFIRIQLTEGDNSGYYCTVMLDQLPEFIDPVVFTERQSRLQGRLGLQRLERLSDILFNEEGELKIDLQFYKQGKVPVIEGRIEGEITLTCQSCMEALSWSVDKAVSIGMVQTIEQADRLAGDLEPMMVSEQKMSLPGFIEDEVIISLPDFPKHAHECLQYESPIKPAEPRKIKQESDNPFAVLATLKNTGDQ
ncbi:metal-binding protein [Methylococcaceae bacterium CS5]|nr:metal-binding protein [Methylococcaceae bacterium CS4]TXK99176.1 metal-binding protein [Methylococcaceae bacterium CS5]TXL08740.1 metal-binding protein [Methylococcaceae bacterium CS3]